MTEQLKIQNCPVPFKHFKPKFKCPELWKNLNLTGDEKVRHCDKCNRDVYLAITDEDLGRAIRLNRCIAMEVPEELRSEYNNARFMVGEPLDHIGPITKRLIP